MADSITQTTHTTWFQRIGKAFKGIVIGFILFIAAFPLLFWNEGRTIKQTKSLKQTDSELNLAKCDEINQDFESKPVYMTGVAKTEETLEDDYFPVIVNGFKLRRNVEMYQWVEEEHTETKRNVGGSEDTVTTYTYSQQWVDRPIDSSSFKETLGHENPSWDFKGDEIGAKSGMLGAFTLTESIIDKMNWCEPLKVEVSSSAAPQTAPENSSNVSDVPSEIAADESIESEPAAPISDVTKKDAPEGFVFRNGRFCKGDPDNPSVGDIRVSFEYIPPAVTISLISQQSGNTFTPYLSNSESVELVEKGTVIPDNMLKSANRNDAVIIWTFRLVGFFIMFIGLTLITTLIPQDDSSSIIDWIIDFSLVFISFCLAFAFSLATIAVAWFYHEPIIGCLILFTGGAIWTLIIIVKYIMVQLKRKYHMSRKNQKTQIAKNNRKTK